MNSQREVIYTRRRHALHGERVEVDILNMIADYCDSLTEQLHNKEDYDTFNKEIIRSLSIDSGISAEEYSEIKSDAISEILKDNVLKAYERRMDIIAKQAYPVLKNIQENQGHLYENILVPIGDGHKILNTAVNLRTACDSEGKELGKAFGKTVMLITIDEYWKEHLREMDDLKQSVQNAAWEQKDPLLIYKFESYQLFSNMLNKVAHDMVSMLVKAHIPLREDSDTSKIRKADQQRRTDMSRMQTKREDRQLSASSGSDTAQSNAPVRVEKKIGRNDLCPCGSGKKYKNCHGSNSMNN
jgi:preprotein translocase subunit SecA